MGKILITGATGNLGNAIAQQIIVRQGADNLVVMFRKLHKASQAFFEAGAELRYGDYDNIATLIKAFRGIDKLFMVASSEIAKRCVQHTNIVEAAKIAGVKHIIYTSYIRSVEDASSPLAYLGAGHLAAEKAIFESEIPFTILKQSVFFENIPWLIGKDIFEKGSLVFPANDGSVGFVSREDLVEASDNILLENGHEFKDYKLTGSQKYTFKDIAQMLSELSGKNIKYISPKPEEYLAMKEKEGIALEDLDKPLAFAKAIAQGESDFAGDDLEKILKRKPKAIQAFLKEAYRL